MRSRRGSFRFTEEAMVDCMDVIAEALTSIGFFTLHIEANRYRHTTTYYGVARDFEEVVEGVVAPKYNLIISVEDGVYSYEIKKLTLL